MPKTNTANLSVS